jgi:outer membrane protein TolC
MKRRRTFDRCAARARLAAAILSVALVATGCARFSPDGGMFAVETAASTELGKDVIKIRDEGDAAAVSARVKGLLAKPLTAAGAVQIALINNRGLQAAYNELGISEAQMVDASLPPAPTLSFQSLVGSGGFEIQRQIVQNVLALLTLPRRRDIAEARFRQAQARAVEMTLQVAMEAARAYYRAVAASEAVRFLEESRLSAETASELAKQLGETGATSKLDQAREHAFYAEVSGQVATARLRQRSDRERLIRALGLWGSATTFRLPGKLPALPTKPRSLSSVEREAVLRRTDLIIVQTRNGQVEIDKISRRGFLLDAQIPIYDFGETRVRRAEETYMQACNRLFERAVNVRSEAREAYQLYRGAYDIARHYEREVLPLRKIILDETMLNYNAMIRDLFVLLGEARARISANMQAIEARREFWLASVDLHAAIVGGRIGGETSSMPRPSAQAASAQSGAH